MIRELTPEAVKVRYRSFRGWWLSRDLRGHGPTSLPAEEIRASASVSVIVPVHDAPRVTARCLSSLEKFGGEAEVVIVDDGSKLETVQAMLRESCSRHGWKLIRHDKARGHSRASEAGVSASTRPCVCLLNSDTVVTSHSWAALVQAFALSPLIAVAGPSTSHTFGPQQIARASCCRHYWSDEQIWCFAERYVAQHRQESLVDVPFVGGFAFFIRRTAWEELHGFDTNLADYGNEAELCQRVLQKGWRIVWSKGAYIHHLGNESYGSAVGPASIRERSRQADLYIQRKHG